jgi:hypothetical protein
MDLDKKSNEIKNRILAVMKPGSCFGVSFGIKKNKYAYFQNLKNAKKQELAFLYNTTRAATVSSLTDMELISIGRADFFNIFMSNRGEEPEHIQFLRKCPFLDHWPIDHLLENPSKCVFHYYKYSRSSFYQQKKLTFCVKMFSFFQTWTSYFTKQLTVSIPLRCQIGLL